MSANAVSIVMPSYQRAGVLLRTLDHLLGLEPQPGEILVVDQTDTQPPDVARVLTRLGREGRIRWMRHQPPGVVGAMNCGMREAKGDIVLFLDDDIIPDANLVAAHRVAHERYPEALAVAGRVVQGENEGKAESGKQKLEIGREDGSRKTEDVGENAETLKRSTEAQPSIQACVQPTDAHSPASGVRSRVSSTLRRDLDFAFDGDSPCWVENVMAGNLSVKREKALAIGGFDENFIPPVSFRFETDFARRMVAAGGRIRFEPNASILHLRAASGGTRSQGLHLTSASPIHGVGDYYYALKHGKGWDRIGYIFRRPFREVRTHFHLRHPWWIPVKLIGELRAIWMAAGLHRAGAKLRSSDDDAKAFYDAQYAGSRYATYAEPAMHPFHAEINRILDQYGRRSEKWLEVGCGRGFLQDVVVDYTGVDVTATVASFLHKPFCCAPAEALPFEASSFDGLWSYAVLEHVENPEQALSEMRRVLKSSGLLILSPAWQCRAWAGRDYAWKPWRDLSLLDGVRKALIPLRNAVPVRACFIFPRRALHLINYFFKKSPLRFYARALTPSYSDYNVIDADARHHIDPFDAILWFRSRGDRVLSHPGWRRSFLVRTGPLVIEMAGGDEA